MGVDQLLQVLNQDNHMSAIPPPGTQNGPMPRTLLKLKESIKGIPFALDTPSMAQAMQVFNMVQGLLQMVQQAGNNPQSVGNSMPLFAKANSSVANADPYQIAQGLSTADIVAAVGPVVALGAGLTQFISAPDTAQLNGLANGSVQPA